VKGKKGRGGEKGKERKGKERKGKERKGKERRGKERKGGSEDLLSWEAGGERKRR